MVARLDNCQTHAVRSGVSTQRQRTAAGCAPAPQCVQRCAAPRRGAPDERLAACPRCRPQGWRACKPRAAPPSRLCAARRTAAARSTRPSGAASGVRPRQRQSSKTQQYSVLPVKRQLWRGSRGSAPGAAAAPRALCSMTSYGWPACASGAAQARVGARKAKRDLPLAAPAACASRVPAAAAAPARATLGRGPRARSAARARWRGGRPAVRPHTRTSRKCRPRRAHAACSARAAAPRSVYELRRQQAAALLLAEDVADARLPKRRILLSPRAAARRRLRLFRARACGPHEEQHAAAR
jgi:hypothetical protein